MTDRPPIATSVTGEADAWSGPWRFLRWLPIVLLLTGVLAHTVLAQTVNANPQAGSGFAMFSGVDFTRSRNVSATATIDGESYSVEIPGDLDRDVRSLRREPTNNRAQALARDLATYSWDISGGTVRPAEPGSPDDTARDLTSIEVTVRGLDAEGRTLLTRVIARGTLQ